MVWHVFTSGDVNDCDKDGAAWYREDVGHFWLLYEGNS